MTRSVVVLGAGYAGAAAVAELEPRLDGYDAELVWVSREPVHFVRHEAHRLVREPAAADALTIPVADIASSETSFVQGTVDGLDVEDRIVALRDGRTLSYDYLVVAIGSATAFYGLPGVAEHGLVLEGRSDALAIHDRLSKAGAAATRTDPARVVIGGGGLSGVQVAGEIAAFRDRQGVPIDVRLVEAMDRVLPTESPALSRYVTDRLTARDIAVSTGRAVVGATDRSVEIEDRGRLPADLFVWTGGVTRTRAVTDGGVAPPDSKLIAGPGPTANDGRVFVVGDAGFADGDHQAPPTAQAAWQAGTAAGTNVARALRGRSLEPFRYRDRGTLLSVGDEAIAHGVPGLPRQPIDGFPAAVLKKGAAARWIASIASPRHALAAWRYL